MYSTSIYQSFYLWLHVNPSIYLYIFHSIYLSIYISINLYVYLLIFLLFNLSINLSLRTCINASSVLNTKTLEPFLLFVAHYMLKMPHTGIYWKRNYMRVLILYSYFVTVFCKLLNTPNLISFARIF